MDPNLLVAARLAAIIAIVDVLKDIGLAPRFAVMASTMVGVGLFILGQYVPGVDPLILGLAASGLYAIRKAASAPDAPAVTQ